MAKRKTRREASQLESSVSPTHVSAQHACLIFAGGPLRSFHDKAARNQTRLGVVHETDCFMCQL